MSHRIAVGLFALASAACSSAPVDPGIDAGAHDAATAPVDAHVPTADGGPTPSASGIDQVFAGEYVTTFLHEGRMYSIGGLLYRRGSGDHPPAGNYPPAEVDIPASARIVTGAGGLHFTIAADADGHVYEWGDIGSNPDLANHNSPIQITNADGTPFVLAGGPVSMSASSGTSGAVAADGSVWVWDDCSNGLAGDGTAGNAMQLHPIRVTLPADVHATRLILGDVAIVLDDMGRVWTWGGTVMENLGTGGADPRTPHQITETSTHAAMPAVVDVASGGPYSYALTAEGHLYAWGIYLEIAGHCPTSGWCPESRPALLDEVLVDATAGGAHVVRIRASSGGSYAILSDGTLWGWGTNGQGLVGDGHEPDYAHPTDPTATPYSWDWNKDALLVTRAVHIAPSVSNFVDVFSGTALVFYAYALTADGHLYSWGRNKTANLGSGIEALNSQQASRYPNSWDVTTPTEVDPLHTTDMPVSSPACVTDPAAPSCWCGDDPTGPQNC